MLRAQLIQTCLTPCGPWTVAYQGPLSMEFFRQEYWSGFPFPSPGALPNPGIEPASLACPTFTSGFFTTSATWEAPNQACVVLNTGLYLLGFTLLVWFRCSSYSILVLALWILSVFPTFVSVTKLQTNKKPSSNSCGKGFFLIQLLVSKEHSLSQRVKRGNVVGIFWIQHDHGWCGLKGCKLCKETEPTEHSKINQSIDH